MGYRLSKIYTRTGDNGTTQVEAKNRIFKNDILIETLGTVDETNSAIGLILAYGVTHTEIRHCLTQAQHDLFNLGGELCPPHRQAITSQHVLQLEEMIDKWNEKLPPLKEFILPGGNMTAAACHVARTICRRAERCLVALHRQHPINLDILRYINRLSDTLFVAARVLAKIDNQEEVTWEHISRPH
jgi:cob(I)alamin adenosyltransferase